MYKYAFIILLLALFARPTFAQHTAHFETKDFNWNGIIFTIAEESEILKNTKDSLEIKVQQQHMLISKQKGKNKQFTKAILPFSKKYKTKTSEVYTKETADFNTAYLFRAQDNKFTVSILLKKKKDDNSLYYLDMYTNTLMGQLTTEHTSALKFMVEMLIDNLKL